MFEYHVVTSRAMAVEQLNELGKEGWQLVAVDGATFVFMRHINDGAKQRGTKRNARRGG